MAIIGLAGGNILMAVILGGMAYFISRTFVIPSDLSKHEEENNAKADAYISQNVEPLRKRLDEVYALANNLNEGGKVTWAMDVVGKDMFYSACIDDLYMRMVRWGIPAAEERKYILLRAGRRLR